MKVRDLRYPKTEYRGRPTEAFDAECPCRPCYQPHNMARTAYGNKPVFNMRCATRDRSGCPEEADRQPDHDRTRSGRCMGCGTYPDRKKPDT